MKKVVTVLALAMFAGACYCPKCTTTPNRSNTCPPPAPKRIVKVVSRPLPPPPPPATPKADEFAAVAVAKQPAADKLVLNFKEPVNFKYNSDEIQPESLENIQQVANVLKKYPNASVRAVGYTDSLGNADYNVDLSQRRAKAVANQLIKDGVNEANVSYVGYGAKNPIATNKTAAGRYQNRRVELEVTNK